MPLRRQLLFCLLAVVMACGVGCRPAPKTSSIEKLSWEQIVDQARGQTVNLAMWQGDPSVNAYMRGFVALALQTRYGITLRIVPGQGGELVSSLMTEIEAGKGSSEIDLLWINGETFYQLRQLKALYGPFTERLPNSRYVDFGNPFIGIDFQQPVNGMECPWGNVQLLLVYNQERVPEPPRTRAALTAWVQAHPGRFTFDSSFTGMSFLKSLLYEIAGSHEALTGPFDEANYARHSAELWTYLKSIQPYLWREGKTFPASVTQQHQLFASGEIDFTLSMNDGEVDNKVAQGLFPPASRAYVLDGGTIQNSHYMGIVARSPHLAGAMVVCNFLISPEAQLEKQQPEVWGDGTVLALDRLTDELRAKFRAAQRRQFSPSRSEIANRALPEPAAEYMVRLYADFRTQLLR